MSYTHDDPNHCAKEFMEHLKRIGCIVSKEVSNNINTRILVIKDERTRRELNQACNLELVINWIFRLLKQLMICFLI